MSGRKGDLDGHATFSTIVADPDWRYDNFGQAKHGAARSHYPGTTADDIASIPVGRWARKDSILLLWATYPKLDKAIDVLRAWGFRLVTACPWIKTTPSTGEIKRGIGFWWQGTSELLLVGRRGNAAAPSKVDLRDQEKQNEKVMGLLTYCEDYHRAAMSRGRSEDSPDFERTNPIFYAPRGPHSRKPPSLVEWIESRLKGPYLELYARVDRPGWTCWGHATGWHLSERGVERLDEVQA